MSNYFSEWYYTVVKGNPDRIKEVVDQDPDAAMRLVSVFHDKDIARLFVDTYSGSVHYRSSAMHIAAGFGWASLIKPHEDIYMASKTILQILEDNECRRSVSGPLDRDGASPGQENAIRKMEGD